MTTNDPSKVKKRVNPVSTNDPSNLKKRVNAVSLNSSNASSVITNLKLLTDPTLWHKITVQNNEDLHRDFILKTILDDVHPLDFIPLCYSTEGQTASFFVRSCQMAIEKLCRQDLVVANPQNKDKPLRLSMILAFTSTNHLFINVEENILAVLDKRYDAGIKTLNLDNFYKDPGLTEFCALSQPKILYLVLHLSHKFSIQVLRLSNNDIRVLSPIALLWKMKFDITTLDLRNNMISEITELSILKTMRISELYLDGNPLCDNYDKYTYLQAVKEVCRNIVKLDGMLLTYLTKNGMLLGEKGFVAVQRNFLCNSDGQDLVDQFLEHYFTLYDTANRSILQGLYHKNAMFSLTCQHLRRQVTTAKANLNVYNRISRNLKLVSNLARSEKNLIRGGRNIIKTLCSLPRTEHDPYTFTVDLLYYSESTAIVTVTGVFREVRRSRRDSEQIIGFFRTFTLASAANGEYNITNEQLFVSNATTEQQQRAFKIARVAKDNHFSVKRARTAKEKNEMAHTLEMITSLNLEWSKKFLEDCHYDLKKALLLFVDFHKVDKIPEEAFTADTSK